MAPSEKREHSLCHYSSCSLGMLQWHIHSTPPSCRSSFNFSCVCGRMPALCWDASANCFPGTLVSVWGFRALDLCAWGGQIDQRCSIKAGVPILAVTRSCLLSSVPCSKSSRNNSSLEEFLLKRVSVLLTALKYIGRSPSKVSSYFESGRNDGYKRVVEFTLIVHLVASI